MQTEIGKDIEKAARILIEGDVVAIPTETVYGLAGNALNEEAVLKIFNIKNRPLHNPLIIHIAGIDRLEEVAERIPDSALKLFQKFSPGPITLLLPGKNIVPALVSSGLERVAVRIPDHPLTLDLLNKLPFPLAAPSANPFGYISPTTARHVEKQLGGKIRYILDGGPCRKGLESTVIGFENETPIVYRLGALSLDSIRELVADVQIRNLDEIRPAGPGMLEQHYSPHTPFLISEQPEIICKKYSPETTAAILYKSHIDYLPEENQIVLSPSGDLEEAARNLYAAMHQMDTGKFSVIIAELFPEEGLGLAINDRLRRAAAKK